LREHQIIGQGKVKDNRKASRKYRRFVPDPGRRINSSLQTDEKELTWFDTSKKENLDEFPHHSRKKTRRTSLFQSFLLYTPDTIHGDKRYI
jgi:hypothetical protein